MDSGMSLRLHWLTEPQKSKQRMSSRKEASISAIIEINGKIIEQRHPVLFTEWLEVALSLRKKYEKEMEHSKNFSIYFTLNYTEDEPSTSIGED
jgi:hypothetical protein